jgi:GPH family glycoside/pentoside/hexuronide:cation symporter
MKELVMRDGAGLVAVSQDDLKPPVHVKLFYSLGEIAQSGGFSTAIPFVFFYYTAVLGLSGGLVGAAMAISLGFDAVFDPLIGSWSDNISSRLGRRLPLMIAATPLMCVALVLLFSPPAHLTQQTLFVWLTATSIAVRGLLSLFNVPYITLGAEMADGYAERSRVVAWRTVAGIGFGVVITALAYMVFFTKPLGLLRAEGYPGFGLAVGLLVFVAAAICCAGVARYAARLPRAPTVAASIWRRLPTELGEIFRNASFRILFFAAVIFGAASGANGTLDNHVRMFVWKLQPWMMQSLGYIFLVSMIAGVALAPQLARRVEKKTMLMVALVMILLVWTVLPVLRASGLYAPTGIAAMAPLGLSSALNGIASGFAAIAFPSMMADAADEHELLFAARREGLYFSGLGFAGKAASGVGALFGGFALDLLRFPHDASLAGVAPSPATLDGLILTWGLAPALLLVVGMVIIWRYAIDRRRHDVITAELQARRALAKSIAC